MEHSSGAIMEHRGRREDLLPSTIITTIVIVFHLFRSCSHLGIKTKSSLSHDSRLNVKISQRFRQIQTLCRAIAAFTSRSTTSTTFRRKDARDLVAPLNEFGRRINSDDADDDGALPSIVELHAFGNLSTRAHRSREENGRRPVRAGLHSLTTSTKQPWWGWGLRGPRSTWTRRGKSSQAGATTSSAF